MPAVTLSTNPDGSFTQTPNPSSDFSPGKVEQFRPYSPDLRLECLRMAAAYNSSDDPSQVVERAKAYFEFLKG